jgi:hypothetical protein
MKEVLKIKSNNLKKKLLLIKELQILFLILLLIIKKWRVYYYFLDIDGGINIYEDGKIFPFFNLYDIKDIKQEEKNKKFFSMGYSYYIRYNLNYFAISSDYGCYVLKIN